MTEGLLWLALPVVFLAGYCLCAVMTPERNASVEDERRR